MRRSSPSKSRGSHAPHAHTTRSASSTRPSSSATPAPDGRAAAATRAAPAATACSASTRVASRARSTPASGSYSPHATSSPANDGNSSRGSTRAHGMSSARSVRSLAASQPSSACASHSTPDGTTSPGSISCQSAHARRADAVCHSSAPWPQRMIRDSSPDPARTWPGKSASTSVTSQPDSAHCRASDAPNTPAPTTITERFTAAAVPGADTVGSMSTTAPATRTIASNVGGKPQDDGPGGTLTSVNPANTDDAVAEVRLGDAGTFVAACEEARAAQREWAQVPAPIRGRAIQQIGRLVEDNKEALARLVTREIGKPYAESLGEVQEIVDTCNFFLGEGRRLYGQTVPSEMPDKQLFTFRVPVGVAAIVTAGNFPVAVPSWYLVPALLCGNTVVWKPADYTPALGEALTSLFRAGGLPDGCLEMVQADAPTTFAGLERALDEALVDKVGFTGLSAVGREIGALCGRHLQSPCLELGGKNPMVVTADADLDLAVQGALFGGFGTAGQRCTSLATAIVQDAVHDAFVARLTAAVEAAPIGDPTQDVLYGPLIHEKFLDRFVDEHLALIRDHHAISGSTGVGRITVDNPRDGFVGDPARGLYVHPTIVAGVRLDDELANTETFGPLVGVARYGEFDEAIAFANGHGYGLSSAIYTTDATSALRFRERVSAGMVSVNNSTSGAEAHLPFGGNGKSGNGSRQSGVWVLDQFTRWQSMNWDYAGRLQKAQMDVA